jgi:aldehyde dehydrogenase (NAD+)
MSSWVDAATSPSSAPARIAEPSKGRFDYRNFFIDGGWVQPHVPAPVDVVSPSTLEVVGTISYGSQTDVDAAVDAAQRAAAPFGATSVAERKTLLVDVLQHYRSRLDDLAEAMSLEMGAPIDFARSDQAGAGAWHLQGFIDAIDHVAFDAPLAGDPTFRLIRVPVGVVAIITPWNWPMNQLTLKVGAALAAGCPMVVKPAETAPLSTAVFFEVLAAAGVPAGVCNLVNGDGPGVGTWLTTHPDVDMISFTGSTRAGVAIGRIAAESGKKAALELGGKSPDLVFADADIEAAVARTTELVFENTGQSCNAPTRMLVERSVYPRVLELVAEAAARTAVGPSSQPGSHIGPLASEQQYHRVQELIQSGIDEGATLLVGGPGKPPDVGPGHFVRPTVFADVTPEMRIQREEIFGPVLTVAPFDSEDEAVTLANDTEYGLAAYVHTADIDRAQRLSRRLRAGMIQFNESGRAQGSPFGGVKLSGHAREGGVLGIEEFLDVVSLSGIPRTEAGSA